ncbi:olfactory receptor 1M1-like [Electrophorus electricus]|uniref:olfactory receptor 1M1-like n=1 Tax=Electrophorus electricus TaxID=8005 RepID=UPI0015D03162|nr:olfactory receptor 1M1-like [Electrophorus electricus]
MSFQNISTGSITEFVIGGFDTVQRPLAVGVVLLIMYILVMTANFANIYFIILDKRLHQPMYLFICNLAFVDMLYCTSSCPTMIGVLVVGCKTISYVPCIFQMFVFHLCGIMETFAIAVMAFDRFIAIGSPLRYRSILTNFRCVLITVLLWMVACAVLSIIPVTILPLPLCQSTLKYVFCDYPAIVRASCVDPNPYFNTISVVSFFIIFVTFGFICFSYLKIVIVVVKMSSMSDKKKVFNTCFSHLIVIVCYYAPTFILIVLTRIGVVLSLEERHGLMVGSILGPSLVNPFIYCLRTKEIRNKVLRILSKVEPAF